MQIENIKISSKFIKNLKILFVASEVSPYIKSGGLGDVAGSLPLSLKKLGADIRVVLPKYQGINQNYLQNLKHISSMQVKLDWRMPLADVLSMQDAPFTTYLIKNDYYFDRYGLYGFGDDYERFAFFSKAAVNMLSVINFKADVIHFNDWQTGLGCVYLSDIYRKFLFYSNTRSLFTIHNLQYQGVFGSEVLPQIDLNYGYFVNDKLEFYNNINYMKAGLAYSNYISTVSPTYAYEVQTPQYGYGLDGLIRSRNHQLFGILNGIDYDEFNPETDNNIYINFDKNSLDKKKQNKLELQKELGLAQKDVPMFAVVSRLAEQKGLDILSAAIHDFLQKDVQLVVLGTGEEHFEYVFTNLCNMHPDKVSVNIRFSASFAHKIYAATDFFLMPSLFEPCGLGQLIAMRYGALPVVRKTGGLLDTVKHYNYIDGTGFGILFEHYLQSGVMWAINEAIHLFYQQQHFKKAQINAMEMDFSWEKSAMDYIRLYSKIKG